MKRLLPFLAVALTAACTQPRKFKTATDLVESRPPRQPRTTEFAPFSRSEPPSALAWKRRSFGKTDRRTLTNGIDVTMLRRGDFPAATLVLALDRGAAYADPGVADAYALALQGDNAEYESGETSQYLRFVSATVKTHATCDGVYLQATAISPLFFSALSRALPMFVSPKVDEKHFETASVGIQASLESHDDARAQAHRLVYRRMFGASHPYAAAFGSVSTAEARAVTRRQVADFRDGYLAAEGVHVVAVGDIDPDGLMRVLEQHLGGLPKKATRKLPSLSMPRSADAGKIVVVDRKGASQSSVAIVLPTVANKDDRTPALQVLAAAIGGGLSSRLSLSVRRELGATYGVRARAVPKREGGVLEIAAEIDTDRTADALRGMWTELGRMAREEVDQELLGIAKRSALDSATGNDVKGAASILAGAAVEGFTPEEFERRLGSYDAIPSAEVRQVAEAFLPRERATTVIVGDAEKILPSLRALGLGEVVIAAK